MRDGGEPDHGDDIYGDGGGLLAAGGQAKKRGLRLLQVPSTNEYFVTSASDPALLHRVTGFSCDCPGFLQWQRCTHHSLLLAELGWLPDLDPEPPVVEHTQARDRLRVVEPGADP